MSAVDRSTLPGLGADPSFRFPMVRKEVLPNGLAVWTAAHRGLPVVSFVLLVRSGAAADPSDGHGLASLTGDMLDEGSGKRSAIEMHEELERIGARFETEVGADASTLILTTLSRYADRGLTVMFDMAVQPRFDVADFERVRQLRVNRLRQIRDVPSSVADRTFLGLVYPRVHPYAHPGFGSIESVGRLSVERSVQFHRDHYRPVSSTLIAVGDFERADLMRVVENIFGGWTGDKTDRTVLDALAGAPIPSQSPGAARTLHLVDRPGAQQSEIRMGHVGVARRTPDYHALQVLNMVLGGQFVSRINMNLRESKGYTYGARTAFDFRRGRGPFVLQTSVQTSVTASALSEARGEIAAIRADRPVSHDELTTAQAALSRGYPRGFETVEQIAGALAQLSLYELPDDYFDTFVPRVSAVTEQDVTRVANVHLDPDRLVTLVVGDRQAVEPTLAPHGITGLDVVDAV